MRIFMLSDTHFGVFPTRGESWLEMMMSYMYDYYLPYLRANARPGDVLIHCGDVFDNRNSINVKVLNRVVRLFEDIGAVMDVYVLIGNHDMFAMADTTVNSTVSIRHVPNVILVEEPTKLRFGDKTALLLPWVHGKESELDVLRKHTGTDLLFCHSDLVGARTQVNPTRPVNRSVCGIDDFAGYGRVFSGHIHIRQQIKNFTFIGAPYHMDRNDVGNTKGIYAYDTETDRLAFHPNTHSPEFKVVDLIKEDDLDQLTPALLDKHYVDLNVYSSLIVTKPAVRTRLDNILSRHKVDKVIWVDDSTSTQQDEDVEVADALSASLELVPMCKEWIMQQQLSDDADVNAALQDEMIRILDDAERIRKSTLHAH
jgi:DNA repair exonuclease SbcCD nuclease subunit